MADDAKPRPSSAPDVRNPSAFTGTVLPYVIAALMASSAMAWYFFIFVPAKTNYFVGLRFRTLAVAAGHVKNKADNLAQALNIALDVPPVHPAQVSEKSGASDKKEEKRQLVSEYLRLVVPDIQNPAIHAATDVVACGLVPQGLDLCAYGEYAATARVAWARKLPL